MPEEIIEDSTKSKKSEMIIRLLRETLHFINQEIELLFKAIIRYSVPLLLLAMLCAYSIDLPARFENLVHVKKSTSKIGLIVLVFSCFTYAASFCTLTLVVNLLFLRKKTEEQKPARGLPQEFKTDFSLHLKKYVFNFLIIYFIYEGLAFGLTYLESISFLTEYEDFGIPGIDLLFQWLIKHGAGLILMPLLVFFSFASLFVSVRYNRGSSDALKEVFNLCKERLPRIWIGSIVFLLIAYLGQMILDYQSNLLIKNLPYNYSLFFMVIVIEKLLSLFLLIVLQVGSVLFFKDLEGEAKITIDSVDQDA